MPDNAKQILRMQLIVYDRVMDSPFGRHHHLHLRWHLDVDRPRFVPCVEIKEIISNKIAR